MSTVRLKNINYQKTPTLNHIQKDTNHQAMTKTKEKNKQDNLKWLNGNIVRKKLNIYTFKYFWYIKVIEIIYIYIYVYILYYYTYI